MKWGIILVALIAVIYMIFKEVWSISVGFLDYEYSASIFLIFLIILIGLYLIHLLRKPYKWIRQYKENQKQYAVMKKEAFMKTVLITRLDHNQDMATILLKQAKSLFPKDAPEIPLVQAVLSPSEAVFEQLMLHKRTELAGIYGLYRYKEQAGDWNACLRLLDMGRTLYPKVKWLISAQYEVQFQLSEWEKALITLEELYKRDIYAKEQYTQQKALIFLKLKKYKEAFALDSQNSDIALAYAKSTPSVAVKVLKKAYQNTPNFEVYLAFKEAIADKGDKRLKLVEDLISKSPATRDSVCALADIAIETGKWSLAKEQLQAYLESFPLTRQIAYMMAEVERRGWNHEENARYWEEKAANLKK